MHCIDYACGYASMKEREAKNLIMLRFFCTVEGVVCAVLPRVVVKIINN